MPIFYIKALRRFRADSYTAISQIHSYIISSDLLQKVSAAEYFDRWGKLQRLHKEKLDTIASKVKIGENGNFSTSYLAHQIRKACPEDTIWVIEAVTETVLVADQLQANLPGSWLNCGGGGLGWSGGAVSLKPALLIFVHLP